MLKHFKKSGKTLANKWTCLILKVADHLKLKSAINFISSYSLSCKNIEFSNALLCWSMLKSQRFCYKLKIIYM